MTPASELWQEVWAAVECGRLGELDLLFDVNAEFGTPVASGHGVEYIREVFDRHRRMYPDLQHVAQSVVESADRQALAAEVVFTGTHSMPFHGPDGREIAASGRQLRWLAVDSVRARNGRIAQWHAVFDRLGLLKQLQSPWGR
jgi:predicted ester cyclase